MERRGISLLVLFVAMLSIQVGASLAKQLFPLLGPSGTTLVRTSLAAILLLGIWRPWHRPIKLAHWRSIAGYGASLGAMNLLFYNSLLRIPLGIAVALEFTGPLTLAIISSRAKTDALWAMLAGLGVFFLLPHSSDQVLDPIGIACALGAGGFWALYIIMGQKSGRASEIRAGDVASLGMVMAALVVLPAGGLSSLIRLSSLHTWLLAICMAVFSSALPYSLEIYAMKHLPTKTFGILMSVEPAIAAIVGYIFLGERLMPLQAGAIICIIAASAGSAAGRRGTPATNYSDFESST